MEESDLRTLADEHGVSIPKTAKPDEIVKRLVESSYPIGQLPNFRDNSLRGAAFGGFVDRDSGKPHKGGTDVEALVKTLQAEPFNASEAKSREVVNLYRRDLVRYYGFSITSEQDGVIKLSDARRKALEKNGQ